MLVISDLEGSVLNPLIITEVHSLTIEMQVLEQLQWYERRNGSRLRNAIEILPIPIGKRVMLNTHAPPKSRLIA